MLRIILFTLILSCSLLSCQSNNTAQKATFYQLLEQELIDRNVLLLDTTSVAIDCYLENIFFATKERVANCSDSLTLLNLNFSSSEINHFMEQSKTATPFLWKQKISSNIIQTKALKENTLIVANAVPVIIQEDTLYYENDKKYLQPTVEWSIPYFSSDSSKVCIKEQYSTSPIEKTTTFRSYVFENKSWQLEKMIQTDSVSLIGHIRYINLSPEQQRAYNAQLYTSPKDTINSNPK